MKTVSFLYEYIIIDENIIKNKFLLKLSLEICF